MRLNKRPTYDEKTHEGATASRMTPEQALRRSVMSCLLWEKEFYEDGVEIAGRIADLATKVRPEDLSALAVETRVDGKLRHVPLKLVSLLAKTSRGRSDRLVRDTVSAVIRRADELAELVAMHAVVNETTSDKVKNRLPRQMRLGIGDALRRFDEYQLAKYDRDGVVKLRDVLRLVHARPNDEAQASLWKRVVDGELATPDTWEVALSAGADKKETFERLLSEGRLGYLALLRNLRNMSEAGVSEDLVRDAILARKGGADRVLPFRYVAAARAAPRYERYLDEALVASVEAEDKLPGTTVFLVDVSGSMEGRLSKRSDLTRMDAAATLASVFPVERARTFTFSDDLVEVPPRIGMAGVEKIIGSQRHNGTQLGSALDKIQFEYDRIVVITDEQSHDRVSDPRGVGYMINVASAKNGVGYGKWVHVDGFSESVIRFVREYERK